MVNSVPIVIIKINDQKPKQHDLMVFVTFIVVQIIDVVDNDFQPLMLVFRVEILVIVRVFINVNKDRVTLNIVEDIRVNFS